MTVLHPLIPCKYGSQCHQTNSHHLDHFSHPCKYGEKCYQKNEEHLRRFSHPNLSSKIQSILPKIPCPNGNNCQEKKPTHFTLHSHPSGPCKDGTLCASHSAAHANHFDHTDEQKVAIYERIISKENCGSLDKLTLDTGILPHKDLENLYNLQNASRGNGFTSSFLKAAFLHGCLVAKEQFKRLQQQVMTTDGAESVANLYKKGKIQYAFGPSLTAKNKVENRVRAELPANHTLAPFADPKDGFKLEGTNPPKGASVCSFNMKKGLPLITGAYHSTAVQHAQSIFEDVKMVSGGYLGQGQYFTVSPTTGLKTSDQDAVIKTMTYGSVTVVALVAGYKGIKYVTDADTEAANEKWDLKYLPPGLKRANHGNSDEKNRGAGELLATDSSQVLPLGIIYVENSVGDKSGRDELLKTLARNTLMQAKL